MDQSATQFLIVIGMGIVVILISRALDIIWSQAIAVRYFYYILRAPGVVIHELCHILACFVMGAKIKHVILFSKKGGSVSYSGPGIPHLGDMVIGTAPLLCIPLVLAGCTWLFSTYLGCIFPPLPQGIDSMNDLVSLGTYITAIFTLNLVQTFNPWFIVYLYITLTLVLSAAPSVQDITNAAIGICMITLAGVLILWSDIPLAVSILAEITRLVGIGFVLGLTFGVVALTVSLPVVIVYIHTRITGTR